MNDEKIDQSVLANDVSSKIKYEFLDLFLVKPLDPIKVQKEFSKPVTDKAPAKDGNGIEAVDYENVETEVKEVDSDFRKGLVLKVPYSQQRMYENEEDKKYTTKIDVGDIIIFRDRSSQFFDLLKDTRMVRYYDIVALEK